MCKNVCALPPNIKRPTLTNGINNKFVLMQKTLRLQTSITEEK